MQETSLKTYNFFNHRETISNISNDYEKLTLNDLNSLKIYAYDKYIFLSCRINNTNQNEKNKPKQTNEYSIIQIFHNQIITNYYHVFNRKLISFCIRKIKFIPHIFCIGCDFKYIQLGSDRTFMTLYSVKIFPINTTINTINDELFLKNLITINLIKDRDTKELLNSDNFLINSESISDINGFDVDEKGEQIVIGSSNGEIILIRNIKKYNDKKEYNISLLVKSTKLDITNVKFGRSLNNDILIYVTTENEIIYYMLNKNTNIYEFNFIYTDNGCQKNVFDVNSITNKVIFCSMINSSLEEINNFDRGACWLFEGSKQKINFFGENLILLNDNNLLVYDSKNKFFSYNTKVLLDKNEQFKVIDFFCSFEKKTIYMIIEKKNNNEEDNDYIDTTKEILY